MDGIGRRLPVTSVLNKNNRPPDMENVRRTYLFAAHPSRPADKI